MQRIRAVPFPHQGVDMGTLSGYARLEDSGLARVTKPLIFGERVLVDKKNNRHKQFPDSVCDILQMSNIVFAVKQSAPMTDWLTERAEVTPWYCDMKYFPFDVMDDALLRSRETQKIQQSSPVSEYLQGILTKGTDTVTPLFPFNNPVRNFISSVDIAGIAAFNRENVIPVHGANTLACEVVFNGKVTAGDQPTIIIPEDRVFGLKNLELRDCSLYVCVAPSPECFSLYYRASCQYAMYSRRNGWTNGDHYSFNDNTGKMYGTHARHGKTRRRVENKGFFLDSSYALVAYVLPMESTHLDVHKRIQLCFNQPRERVGESDFMLWGCSQRIATLFQKGYGKYTCGDRRMVEFKAYNFQPEGKWQPFHLWCSSNVNSFRSNMHSDLCMRKDVNAGKVYVPQDMTLSATTVSFPNRKGLEALKYLNKGWSDVCSDGRNKSSECDTSSAQTSGPHLSHSSILSMHHQREKTNETTGSLSQDNQVSDSRSRLSSCDVPCVYVDDNTQSLFVNEAGAKHEELIAIAQVNHVIQKELSSIKSYIDHDLSTDNMNVFAGECEHRVKGRAGSLLREMEQCSLSIDLIQNTISATDEAREKALREIKLSTDETNKYIAERIGQVQELFFCMVHELHRQVQDVLCCADLPQMNSLHGRRTFAEKRKEIIDTSKRKKYKILDELRCRIEETVQEFHKIESQMNDRLTETGERIAKANDEAEMSRGKELSDMQSDSKNKRKMSAYNNTESSNVDDEESQKKIRKNTQMMEERRVEKERTNNDSGTDVPSQVGGDHLSMYSEMLNVVYDDDPDTAMQGEEEEKQEKELTLTGQEQSTSMGTQDTGRRTDQTKDTGGQNQRDAVERSDSSRTVTYSIGGKCDNRADEQDVIRKEKRDIKNTRRERRTTRNSAHSTVMHGKREKEHVKIVAIDSDD